MLNVHENLTNSQRTTCHDRPQHDLDPCDLRSYWHSITARQLSEINDEFHRLFKSACKKLYKKINLTDDDASACEDTWRNKNSICILCANQFFTAHLNFIEKMSEVDLISMLPGPVPLEIVASPAVPRAARPRKSINHNV